MIFFLNKSPIFVRKLKFDTMKKVSFYLKTISIILIISYLGTSCQKISDCKRLPETNYAQATNQKTKTAQELIIVSDMGHEASSCKGCVYVNGRLVHIDCQGYGNACRVSANMTLYVGGSDLYAVTTDTFGLTDQSYFNMPARSLSTEDEKGQPVYLNIPAQLVYRDSSTQQFTFTGLYYTTNAAYSND